MINVLISWTYLVIFACLFFFIGTAMTSCFGLIAGAIGLAVFTAFILGFVVYIKTDGFSEAS
jgi:hypothetical protein